MMLGAARIMVDELRVWPTRAPRPFREGSCHLTVDGSLDTLHFFAARIGLRRAWFQDHASAPHYDLTPKRRARAIELGAEFVPARAQAKARIAKRLAAARARYAGVEASPPPRYDATFFEGVAGLNSR